jgi:hypothetical protein
MCFEHLKENPDIAEIVIQCITGDKNPHCYPGGNPKKK